MISDGLFGTLLAIFYEVLYDISGLPESFIKFFLKFWFFKLSFFLNLDGDSCFCSYFNPVGLVSSFVLRGDFVGESFDLLGELWVGG